MKLTLVTRPQNVFIMDGDSVRAELERRKFTVEEGDHLTALNAYNAFVKCASSLLLIPAKAQGEADPALVLAVGRKSSKWCHTVRLSSSFSPLLFAHPDAVLPPLVQHRLNFRALSRALSIRTQLAKYLKRFEIPIVSCGEDHTSIRRCLTSGYFRNAAVLQPDGTYRSVREGAVRRLSLRPPLLPSLERLADFRPSSIVHRYFMRTPRLSSSRARRRRASSSTTR